VFVQFVIGGATLPERHRNKRDEHLRLIDKSSNGASFFISQVVCRRCACVMFVNLCRKRFSTPIYR
jgi:5,10-methylenetetrahydrofolate reductase